MRRPQQRSEPARECPRGGRSASPGCRDRVRGGVVPLHGARDELPEAAAAVGPGVVHHDGSGDLLPGESAAREVGGLEVAADRRRDPGPGRCCQLWLRRDPARTGIPELVGRRRIAGRSRRQRDPLGYHHGCDWPVAGLRVDSPLDRLDCPGPGTRLRRSHLLLLRIDRVRLARDALLAAASLGPECCRYRQHDLHPDPGCVWPGGRCDVQVRLSVRGLRGLPGDVRGHAVHHRFL